MGNIFQKQTVPSEESYHEEEKKKIHKSLQLCRNKVQQLEKQGTKSQSILALLRATANQHRLNYEKEQQKNKLLVQENNNIRKENQELLLQLENIEQKLESLQNLFK